MKSFWKIGTVFLFFLCWFQPVVAQLFPSQVWHKGYFGNQSDTVHGFIKYDLINDVIQFEGDEKILTFTPESVSFFQIYDELLDAHRRFYSLPYRTGGYAKPTFFELLFGGKVALGV